MIRNVSSQSSNEVFIGVSTKRDSPSITEPFNSKTVIKCILPGSLRVIVLKINTNIVITISLLISDFHRQFGPQFASTFYDL